ncbi:MAG TPA: hypothetical protein PKH09_02365 [Parvularculaceae bacterium]|nr:hypothetical protein [Parvularculaceae bacterium]
MSRIALNCRKATLAATNGGCLDTLIRYVNGLIGALLIGAGLFLSRVTWIDIVQTPESDAFRLIQFHFILTGALSLWSSSTDKRGSILASLSLLNLGANGWLAFLAIVARDPTLFWPMLFVAASGINFLYLLAADLNDETKASDIADDDGDDDLVPSQLGAVSAGSTLGGIAPRVGAIVLYIAALFAFLFFGTIYAQLLKATIIDRSDISFEAVIANIRNGAANLALVQFAATAIVVAVLYGAIFLVEALINISRRNSQKSALADFNRDLDQRERFFIRDCLASLLAYLDHRSFDPKWGRLYAIGVVGVIASFIAVPWAAIMLEEIFGVLLEAQRIVGSDPVFYSGPLYIGAAIGGFFAGAGLFWSLYQYLGARFPAFGEYLFARAGWNSLEGRPRTPSELLQVIVRQVRSASLNPNETFDPFAFLTSAFRESEGLVYKATAWSVVATVILVAADIARFTVVDDAGVHYSKYLQLASHRVPFEEIDRIELRCVLFEPDDDGDINLGFDFILVKDGEFRIDLLRTEKDIGNQLARIEEIDSALLAAGTPVAIAQSGGFLRGDKSPFIPTCAEEIEARYDPDIAPRLTRLLRVEQFADARQN